MVDLQVRDPNCDLPGPGTTIGLVVPLVTEETVDGEVELDLTEAVDVVGIADGLLEVVGNGVVVLGYGVVVVGYVVVG